jgi:hypothetical protein
MPAQLRQQQEYDAGNDASVYHNWVVTGHTLVRNAGSNACGMRVQMPAQQGHTPLRNKGNDAGKGNSTMQAMTPVQCGQGHQYNAGKDANPALVESLKAKFSWNDARYSNKATCTEDEHNNNTTYADVSQLHHGWADASLQC